MQSLRFFLVVALFTIFYSATNAQRYKTAAGIRIDNGVGFTLQQYITDGWTAEGILHAPVFTDNAGVTVLAEKHHKILMRGINFYTGAGLHYYATNVNRRRREEDPYNNVMGLSGIAGLELSVGRLNVSVDWKPELHLTGAQAHPFDWNGAAISARYIIAKRERNKIKDWDVWDKFPSRDKNKGRRRS